MNNLRFTQMLCIALFILLITSLIVMNQMVREIETLKEQSGCECTCEPTYKVVDKIEMMQIELNKTQLELERTMDELGKVENNG